jgi:serine/threonine-protein kinase
MGVSRDPKDPFKPGEVIGPYRVVRSLGKGGYGVVYEVEKGELRKRRALKVLLEEWSSVESIVERFRREAHAIAALQHRNIVDVHDLGVIAEGDVAHHVIEMELLTGESLAARIKRQGRLPVTEALDVLLPVVSAMEAVHALKIVHRDLKPENIFLAREPDGSVTPKVLDFGVARVTGDNAEEMTVTGQQVGTPSYMSPEQVRGEKTIDGRADVWALAVILYVLLTGRKPFVDLQRRFQTSFLIEHRAPPPMCDAGVDVPEALEAVIGRALEKSRDARYASVRELGVALVPFARPETRARFETLWGLALDFEQVPPTIESPAAPARALKATETLAVPPLPPLDVPDDEAQTATIEARSPAAIADEHDLPSDAGVERTHAPESSPSSSPRRRHTWALAVLVPVAAGLAAFGVWKRSRPDQVPPVAVLIPSPPRPPPEAIPSPSRPRAPEPATPSVTEPVLPAAPVVQQVVTPPAAPRVNPPRPTLAVTRTAAPRPVVPPPAAPPADTTSRAEEPAPVARPSAPPEAPPTSTAPAISVTNQNGIVRIRRVPGSAP